MNRALWFSFLLVPAMLSAGNLQPAATCVPDESPSVRVGRGGKQAASQVNPLRCLVGTVDTIGGTVYDWQGCGPVFRFLANAPGHGISATWMWLPDRGGTEARNMRYQFYDFSSRLWKWSDPDFMRSGVSAFSNYNSGYGSVDVTRDGRAVISRHAYDTNGYLCPGVARELAPGSDGFEYAEGSPLLENLQRPPLAVGQGDVIHVLSLTDGYCDVSATRIAHWPQFDPPQYGFDPTCGEHAHNLAASKQSGRVCAVWPEVSSAPMMAWYRESQDSGRTWLSPVNLETPLAFGGDTVASFFISSLFPYYDVHDRLHIVTDLYPVIHDTGSIVPSAIWHWCPDNDPPWCEIHRAGCDTANMLGHPGWNALYACRPCIGEDSRGNLYSTWEQFDSSNVETLTDRLRADVFVAASEDNGQTWLPPVKLTDAGTGSCRFPSIAAMAMPGEPDTFMVSFMVDEVAGFWVQGEGPLTRNPIVVQKVPVTDLGVRWPGIAEEPKTGYVLPSSVTVQPNPSRGPVAISLSPSIPLSRTPVLRVYDASGALVLAHPVRTSNFVLQGSSLPSGVYVALLDAAGQHASTRIVLQR